MLVDSVGNRRPGSRLPIGFLLVPLAACGRGGFDAPGPGGDDWSAAPPGCTTGELGPRRFFFCSGPVDWETAAGECRSAGSTLATIPDLDVNTWVFDKVAAADLASAWLGLNDRAVEGVFVWEDGSPVTFTHWNESEPNNFGGNEDCVHGPYGRPGHWNDAPCSASYAFVCGD